MQMRTTGSIWRNQGALWLTLATFLQPLAAYAAFLTAVPVGEEACCRTRARCCCRKKATAGPTVSANACGAGCSQLLPGHVRPHRAVARQCVHAAGFIGTDIELREITVRFRASQASLERSQRPPPV